MPRISVIIPVYNVETYIEKCINSVLNQTFEDFELILVDDRSPDRSVELAKELLKGQSRIPYRIISKEINEGLSAARNTGIENANGSYLLFIDSDDWIEKETLQKLSESVVSTEAEMVICRVRQIYDDGITDAEVLKSLPSGVLTGKQTLTNLFKGEFHAHIWKILFAKSLFHTTRFPVGTVYEDMLTLPYLLVNEIKVCFIDDVLYNYLQRLGSITKSYNPDIIKVCNKLQIMESDFKYLLDNQQKVFFVRYVYLGYLTLVEHASILSPSYAQAEEVLLACKKSIKTIELFKQLMRKPGRSMLLLLLLKASPYKFFKRYN
jgi:glycosyltransferase involved in cell wall biosynthesis